MMGGNPRFGTLRYLLITRTTNIAGLKGFGKIF